ncbi:MAG: MBL fold metallo-hydrolase [Acidobacteria bacterium]|nr:MBL fold metallo-hydrolase [Acidobacteriota bacterium]
MQKVTDHVYIESESSVCNAGIVATDDGVAVIDTPMVPSSAKKLAHAITRFGAVRYVINTEPHMDHIAGNCYFGGTIVAHDGVRARILAAKEEEMTGMLQRMAPDNLPLDKEFRFRPPEITFSEKLTLHLGQFTLRLIHMPGHTPHSLAVYIPEEKIVFTSDNVNLQMPFFGDASPDLWLKTLERYNNLDVEMVVPGHGSVCDKGCFPKMSLILESWIDAVDKSIKKGLDMEQTLEELAKSEIASRMPEEGPEIDLFRLNVEKLYGFLKR